MKRYLIPIQEASQAETIERIPVTDSPVGLYRKDNGNFDVVAEADDRIYDLGVRDAGVSRKSNGQAPVELSASTRGINVENLTSTNPILVETGPGQTELAKGEFIEITDDCVIELGIGVKIRANVRGTVDESESQEVVTKEESHRQEGPEITAYVQTAGELIRKEVEKEAVTECHTHIQTLYDTIIECPVDDQAYNKVESDMEHVLQRLDNKVTNATLSETDIADEFQHEIVSLTNRVESLYARH
ncbi:hypothetical protein DM826_02115 [Halonotius aquaticus]|uniref:Uncharacterized protein n=1 Tax=Halonotius aquaticus TaxID=2216978 RepID=A0A3A6QEA0_9EURY|nr:hypothetical protein [Halonotius aquaticus]RJX44435.1 hypothetical protein DM826_02115 [Halonotius aquaticus]